VKLYLVSGWATKSTVWDSVIRILKDELDVECIDWWSAIDGELGRRITVNSNKCVVAGWSVGGQIALMEAARHPDNIAGLFLISSMTCLVEKGERPGVPREVPAQIRVMLERNRRVYLRGFFTRCVSPLQNPQLIDNLLEESDTITMESLLSGLEFMADTEAMFTKKASVMMVHGREDDIIPWECTEYIGRHISSNPQVKYLENTGHMLPLNEHETVGNLLNEFCDYCFS
jgi:pimeloyl-ACP methyl ester carboxylesterase